MKLWLYVLTFLHVPAFSGAERAQVTFNFVVHPTGTGGDEYRVIDLEAATVRRAFPPGDILITDFTFAGVRVQGVPIKDHMEAKMSGTSVVHGETVAHDGLTYHHTLIHMGSREGFSHAHGGLVYGTAGGQNHRTLRKRTQFHHGNNTYGIRLRPESLLFTCIHAKNARNRPEVYTSHWEIEYEALENVGRDSRALVAGWFHTAPSYDTRTKEAIEGFTHPFEIFFMKNVRLVGFVVHSHSWLSDLTVKHAGEVIFHTSPEKSMGSMAMTMDDNHVRWLDNPRSISMGGSMFVNVSGKYDPYSTRSSEWFHPFALSFYVVCDDGTDHYDFISDLYLIRGLTEDAQLGFGDEGDKRPNPNYAIDEPWPSFDQRWAQRTTDRLNYDDKTLYLNRK